jgi:ribose transport system ATP-binding protein
MQGFGVSLKSVAKTFEGVRALSSVDIDVAPGSVHALLGANGSGKSTLVKILTGVYSADSGTITVGRESVGSMTPQLASRLGIRSVQQESPLIDTLSVAENFALFRGYPRVGAGWISWRKLRERVTTIFEQFGILLDPEALVASLTAAERAIVSIAIAMDSTAGEVGVLVLDEATASLPEAQATQLLDVVAGLARSGLTVLMVTHRVREVAEYADHVTVLDGGSVVYDDSTKKTSVEKLYALLGAPPAGSKSAPAATAGGAGHPTDAASTVLTAGEIHGHHVHGANLRLGRGEILGIAGLADSGVAELTRILGGVLPKSAGVITLRGEALPSKLGPGSALQHGIVFVPSDRKREGGAMTISVLENLMLPTLKPIWKRGRAEERRLVDDALATYDVHPQSPHALLGTLSGGNQQKAIIGKWMLTEPTVMILEDPTSGVDPGSRERIFRLVKQAADRGVGIILTTSEPAQFETFCDRVLLVQQGTITSELTGPAITHEGISRWLTE